MKTKKYLTAGEVAEIPRDFSKIQKKQPEWLERIHR